MRLISLANGSKMPIIGIGTYQIRDKDTIFKVLDVGLRTGYRLIDTAAGYGNEQHISQALESLLPKYGLTRDQLFITSKLAPKDQGAGVAKTAALQSLNNLQLDYIDLYLIHWPGTQKLLATDQRNKVLRSESWRDLEDLYKTGKLRAIGVSNYNVDHLEHLLGECSVQPVVNQCEFHPHYTNRTLLDCCRSRGIHFQAYSSFGSPSHKQNLFGEQQLQILSAKYDCSVANLLLAWAMAQTVSVLPRSVNEQHVQENFASSQLELNPEDVAAISALNEKCNRKYCWDPSNVV